MKAEDLVRLVKKNDNEAFKEIIEIYKPMVYSFIQSNRLELGDYSVNRDDLYQEGLIALHQACLLYDDKQNASFHTFAHLVVKRKIKRVFLQNYRRYKYERYSIDSEKDGMSYKDFASKRELDDPKQAYLRKEDGIFARAYFESLNPIDQNIVNLRINDCSYQEISERLSLSKKNVDNRIQKIRRRFKELAAIDKQEKYH